MERTPGKQYLFDFAKISANDLHGEVTQEGILHVTAFQKAPVESTI